jgi:hypothetical protein
MRTMSVACKQPAYPTTVKKDEGRQHGRCSSCPTAKDRKRLELSPVLKMGVQGPLYQDNSINMRQLEGTIILDTHFIHNYVINYSFLFSNILCILLYIIPQKMKNFNKSHVLSSTESINRTLKTMLQK